LIEILLVQVPADVSIVITLKRSLNAEIEHTNPLFQKFSKCVESKFFVERKKV